MRIIYWLLFFAAMFLGVTGCIFDDVVDQRSAVVCCAILGMLIVGYVLKCMLTLAEDLDTQKPIERESATILDLP